MMLLNKEAMNEFMKKTSVKDVNGFNHVMGNIAKEVIEVLLEGELTSYLGYAKYDQKNNKSGNSRNGSTNKSLRSHYGELEIAAPRDRRSEFKSELIKKRERDIMGIDERVISMYSKGMTSEDIIKHVGEIYGHSISKETISTITDGVLKQAMEWQSRPLKSLYVIAYLDALYLKMRTEGHVKNVAIYTILGITLEGKKDCLGLWVGESGESSTYWATILNEIKNRGLQDVLIFCVDNLAGISDAIGQVYPEAEIQKCVVHQIRNSVKYVSYKDRKELCDDMKEIYRGATEEEGLLALEVFEEKWNKKYPSVIESWKRNWGELATFFKYPAKVRTLIYTTNSIERMNRSLRKVTKNKGSFPRRESIMKLLYLAVSALEKKWTGPIKDWSDICPEIVIFFKERVKSYMYDRPM